MTRFRWIALPLVFVFLIGAYLGLKARRSQDGPPAVLTEAGVCPDRPNCVSSGQVDGPAAVDPFFLIGEPSATWPRIVEATREHFGGRDATTSATVLHVTSRSPIFGFVDDLWLFLAADQGRIDVRSQSRVGYSDLGKNRHRVEELQAKLMQLGLVRTGPDS